MWLLIIFMMICADVYAGQFTVKTGFGYLTDANGHIVSKAEYPIGTVNVTDGYTYTEVSDENTMNAIQVYQPPLTPSQKQVILNDQAQAKIIANTIANDPTLKAQQDAITATQVNGT